MSISSVSTAFYRVSPPAVLPEDLGSLIDLFATAQDPYDLLDSFCERERTVAFPGDNAQRLQLFGTIIGRLGKDASPLLDLPSFSRLRETDPKAWNFLIDQMGFADTRWLAIAFFPCTERRARIWARSPTPPYTSKWVLNHLLPDAADLDRDTCFYLASSADHHKEWKSLATFLRPQSLETQALILGAIDTLREYSRAP